MPTRLTPELLEILKKNTEAMEADGFSDEDISKMGNEFLAKFGTKPAEKKKPTTQELQQLAKKGLSVGTMAVENGSANSEDLSLPSPSDLNGLKPKNRPISKPIKNIMEASSFLEKDIAGTQAFTIRGMEEMQKSQQPIGLSNMPQRGVMQGGITPTFEEKAANERFKILSNKDNVKQYLSARVKEINDNIESLKDEAASASVIAEEESYRPTFLTESEDFKQKATDLSIKINDLNKYKEDLVGSAIPHVASLILPERLKDLSTFDAVQLGAEIMDISDPDLRYKLETAAKGGYSVPYTTKAQFERLGLEATKSFLEQNIDFPNAKEALKIVEQQEYDYDTRNFQLTAERVRHKLGAYFYKLGDAPFSVLNSGLFGHSKERLLKAINDPSVNLTPAEKEIALSYVVPLEDKIIGSEIPAFGFFASTVRGMEQFGKGVTNTLDPFRTDADRQYENLLGVSTRYQKVGEYAPSKYRLEELRDKANSGKLTEQEKKEKIELENYVDVRNGWTKFMDVTGDITGQVLPMGLMTYATGGIGGALARFGASGGLMGGLTTGTIGAALQTELGGLAVSSYLLAKDSYDKQALDLMPRPDQAAARNWYKGIMIPIEMASERIFNDAKVLKAFMKGASPTVKDIVQKLVSGEITERLAKEQLQGSFKTLLKTFGKNMGVDMLQNASEETIVTIADGLTQSIFGGKDYDAHEAGKEAVETFTTTLMGSGVIAAMSAKGAVKQKVNEDAFLKVSLLNMGKNPTAYYKAVEELRADGLIDQKQANDKIRIIKSANQFLRELPQKRKVEVVNDGNKQIVEKGFDAPEATSYILHRINENQLAEKIKKLEALPSPDQVQISDLKKQLKRSEDIRKGIYEGKIGVTPSMQEITDNKQKAEELGILSVNDADNDDLIGTPFTKEPNVIFTYNKEEEVPEIFKEKMVKKEDGKITVTLPKSEADEIHRKIDIGELDLEKIPYTIENYTETQEKNKKEIITKPLTQIERTELIEKAKKYGNELEGAYKDVFLEDTEGVLFEAAVQANSSESEKSGAIKTFGKDIVDIAQQLFPNAKVGETIQEYKAKEINPSIQSTFEQKVEATAKALEGVDVVQYLRDKTNALRDEQGNIPKDKMDEFKALRKASGAVNDGLAQIPESAYERTGRSKKFTPQEISEAYHKAKADGSNPELVKAVEDLLSDKSQPTVTTKEQATADNTKEELEKIKISQDENEQQFIEQQLPKNDNDKQEPIIKAIESKAENPSRIGSKELSETQQKIDEIINESTNVFNVKISEISTNESEYQGRKNKFSERSAENVAKNYDPNKFDPIILYKHPDGKIYVLSGHSRLEGMKRRGEETIPARFFEGNENEAKEFAQKSNKFGTLQTDIENANYYRGLLLEGKSYDAVLKEAQENEQQGTAKRIVNLAHLNPNGKAIQALEALDKGEGDTKNNILSIASKIGDIRSKNKHLTDSHENELFDFFISDKENIPTDKEILDANNSLNRSIAAVRYNNSEPLNLDRFVYKTPGRIEWEKELKELTEQQNELKRLVNPNKKTGWNGLKEKAIALLAKGSRTKESIDDALLDFENNKGGIKDAYQKQLEQKRLELNTINDKIAKHLLREKDLIQGDKAQQSLFDVFDEPNTENKSTNQKKIADVVRALKIDLSKLSGGGLQSNIAGIPIALYNAAIDTIALALEGGANLTQAIQRAISKHKLNEQEDFNQSEFIAKLEEATGEKFIYTKQTEEKQVTSQNKTEKDESNKQSYLRTKREEIVRGNEVLQKYEDYKKTVSGTISEDAKFKGFKEALGDNFVIDNIDIKLGEEDANGTESLVWFNEDGTSVTKAISYDLEGGIDNLIDKIIVHNSVFPETKIEVLGVGILSDGTNVFIVNQPLVLFKENSAMSKEAITEFMASKGFVVVDSDLNKEYPTYSNGVFTINDLHEGNIGITIGGNIGVIDFFADIQEDKKQKIETFDKSILLEAKKIFDAIDRSKKRSSQEGKKEILKDIPQQQLQQAIYIDTNFDKIVEQLIKNNLIVKKCQ